MARLQWTTGDVTARRVWSYPPLMVRTHRRRASHAARGAALAVIVVAMLPLLPSPFNRGASAASSALVWSAPRRADTAPSEVRFDALSCSSPTWCVAASDDGTLWKSAFPGGGVTAWEPLDVDGLTPIIAISCPVRTFCDALDAVGRVITVATTSGGSSHVAQSTVDLHGLPTGISCPTTSLCVVVDAAGRDFTSIDPPRGAAASWTSHDIDAAPTITSVSCPTTTLCVAVDQSGDVDFLDGPRRRARPAGRVPPSIRIRPSSRSPVRRVHSVRRDDAVGRVLTSTSPPAQAARPGGGAALPQPSPINAMSCVSSSRCIAADATGFAYSTPTPTSRHARWSLAVRRAKSELVAARCMSWSQCLVSQSAGSVPSRCTRRTVDPGSAHGPATRRSVG